MRNITILTESDYENIEHWAALRYSISQIATMLNVDIGELRMIMQNPSSEVARRPVVEYSFCTDGYRPAGLGSNKKRDGKTYRTAEKRKSPINRTGWPLWSP